MKTVLYILSERPSACTQLKITGARQRLESAGFNLHKIQTDDCTSREISRLAAFWNAAGLIVDCRGMQPPISERLCEKQPMVFLDVIRSFSSSMCSSVSYDIRATCNLAARELISLDCASYGFAGYGPDIPWSEERRRVFTQAMKLNNLDTKSFGQNPSRIKATVFYNRLKKWISKMPKPAGILAADDSYALHVHSVIGNLGLRIPSDVALLGVDNETPAVGAAGLSSIQLDFREAGRLAAELLLGKIAHEGAPPRKLYFGPVQLLRRTSTRKLISRKHHFAPVLQKIRELSPRGLTAKEVASWLPGSRRLVEISFRKATGRSILEEITVVRTERAKELLVNTAYSIEEIRILCGYHTQNAFRNAFKAQTGLTPRDWRKNRNSNPH